MAESTEKKMDTLDFLKLVKKAKSFADLKNSVEKAGYNGRGVRLRLASLRNGGLLIAKFADETEKQPIKTRKEKMLELAAASGFKFDAKQFKERAKKTAKA